MGNDPHRLPPARRQEGGHVQEAPSFLCPSCLGGHKGSPGLDQEQQGCQGWGGHGGGSEARKDTSRRTETLCPTSSISRILPSFLDLTKRPDKGGTARPLVWGTWAEGWHTYFLHPPPPAVPLGAAVSRPPFSQVRALSQSPWAQTCHKSLKMYPWAPPLHWQLTHPSYCGHPSPSLVFAGGGCQSPCPCTEPVSCTSNKGLLLLPPRTAVSPSFF